MGYNPIVIFFDEKVEPPKTDGGGIGIKRATASVSGGDLVTSVADTVNVRGKKYLSVALGSTFTIEDDRFAPQDGDMLINAGQTAITAFGVELEKGDAGTVKGGKCSKTAAFIPTPRSDTPATEKTFSLPPGYSFHRGVAWDFKIYNAGVEKAKEFGWRPFSVTTVAVEDGTMWLLGDPLSLQKFSDVAFKDGDMVVAACDRQVRLEGVILNEGEYAVRKDSKFTKMPGRLGAAKPSSEQKPARKEEAAAKPQFDTKPTAWPKFSGELAGRMEVRVKNPNDFKVRVGLRSDGSGKDFVVAANDTESVRVPNGRYEIYFQYSSDPEGLYQGDSFTLSDNGVEIQIVKVVNGNYGIRKVK
jgi:hypothetical protein